MALVPANNFKTIVLLDFSSFKNLEKNPLDYFSVHNNYTFTQDNFAEYEQRTEAYNVIHLYLGLSFFNDLKCALSINNVLNTEYTPHISRIRGVAGGIPNPGRSFEINLHYEF
jgi:outer membrane receptor protein involved in Fe transport